MKLRNQLNFGQLIRKQSSKSKGLAAVDTSVGYRSVKEKSFIEETGLSSNQGRRLNNS